MDQSNFNLKDHIIRQKEWSKKTFGPGDRTYGILDHIRKELIEVEQNPTDIEEWIDIIILALDGAWRNGASADEIITILENKQTINENRKWPDWRTSELGKAIEHVR